MNARRLPGRLGRGSFMLEEEMEDRPCLKLPIDPAAAAARFMVRATLADPAIRELAGSIGSAVVVQVPDASWVELVADQWRMLARGGDDPARGDADSYVKPGSWVSFERLGTERANVAAQGDAIVEKALCTGAAVVGFSPVPDRALPPALLRAADLLVVIPPLTPALMRRVLRAVTGRDWKEPIDPDLTRRLTPSILRLARRPGQGVPDYLERLEAVADKGRPKLRPGPRLEDLAGMDAAVAWGKRVIRDMGDLRAGVLKWADMDRGLLLYGPPGTGKTMFAEALARSSGLPLVGASFAQWQSTKDGNLGDCLRAMRKSFDDARQLAPSILMIDELDAIPDRGRVDEKYRDYWTSVVTCFLELMDGLGGREGVLVIGATNNPDALDPAVVRSGRMDKLIGVQLPDAKALERILRHHLGSDLAQDSLGDAARRAAGATGADCARWVRSARQRARHEARPMAVSDLVREIGGMPMPPDVEEQVSLHEAGHAVVATILRPGKLEQVFIGSAAGAAGWVLVKFEVRSTREAIHARLIELLAGRAAEELVLGAFSGGSGGPAGSDISLATCLATALESALGLGGQGPLWLGLPTPDNVAAMLLQRPKMADAVAAHLDDAYAQAIALVRANRSAVVAVAARLRIARSLTGTEVAAIVLEHGELPNLLGLPS